MISDKTEQWYQTYGDSSDVYESFSEHEDEGNKALHELLKLVNFKGKVVLDIGCGSGKYTHFIAQQVHKYYGLDISQQLLKVAKNKCKGLSNVEFIQASSTDIPLPDNSVDIIFSSWAFPPHDTEEETYAEAHRAIKSRGEIWLIGNYPEGDFMDMRGDEEKRGEQKTIDWYKSVGIELVKIVDSNFSFPSLEEAKRVLGFIFGDKAFSYLESNPNPKLGHKIAIFHKKVEK